MPLLGAFAGAVLAGLLVVVYNTSANVAAFEGGRRHLTFQAGITWIVIGTFVGALVGLAIFGVRHDSPKDDERP